MTSLRIFLFVSKKLNSWNDDQKMFRELFTELYHVKKLKVFAWHLTLRAVTFLCSWPELVLNLFLFLSLASALHVDCMLFLLFDAKFPLQFFLCKKMKCTMTNLIFYDHFGDCVVCNKMNKILKNSLISVQKHNSLRNDHCK